MKTKFIAAAVVILAVVAGLVYGDVTTTTGKLGKSDLRYWDGINSTFTRRTTTGGNINIRKLDDYVDVAQVYGSGSQTFAALKDAVSQIGAVRLANLYLGPGTWNITDDLTVTSNLQLVLPRGASLNITSGKTLTLAIPPLAWDYLITAGSGTLAITAGDVSVEWFGSDSAAIIEAWNSLTRGTVHCLTGGTYSGNVTLVEATYRKEIDGHFATITGNFIVNKSKYVQVRNFMVSGHGEVNGCWSCEFSDMTFEYLGGLFSGSTARSGYYFLVTDSNDSTGFGAYWNVFNRVFAHGLIILPGLNGATSNNGVNSNTWNRCRFQGALATGTLLGEDTDNASIRIDVIGTDTSVNSQSNVCNACDLSDSPYAVKNDNTYEFYVSNGSYVEEYDKTHSGPVEFKDSYVYTSQTTAGDNDTVFSYDTMWAPSNRGSTGAMFVPITDLYGNPGMSQLEYNTRSSTWVPRGINDGGYTQCGDPTIAGSSLTMERDATDYPPTVDYVVLKAVGGSAAPCSVRFLGGYDKAGDSSGSPSAMMLVKGEWTGSSIGFNGEDGCADSLHGSQSSDGYEIITGSCGPSVTGSARAYAELRIGAGQTAYIAQVVIGRGKSVSGLPTYIPTRHEAQSSTGPPAQGYWRQGAIVWNTAGSSYVESSRSIQGTPIGWLCTVTGDFSGSAPTFQELGQIGYREIAVSNPNSSGTKSQRRGEIIIATTGADSVWFAMDDNGTTWVQLSN